MKFSKLVLSGVLGIALLSATSCGTPKNVAYFQDLNNNPDTVITLQNRVITVKPTDKLYIGVKSKDPQISQLFNLTGGTSGSGAYNMSQDAYYYTVDSKGDIDFPVVGKIDISLAIYRIVIGILRHIVGTASAGAAREIEEL